MQKKRGMRALQVRQNAQLAKALPDARVPDAWMPLARARGAMRARSSLARGRDCPRGASTVGREDNGQRRRYQNARIKPWEARWPAREPPRFINTRMGFINTQEVKLSIRA
jgi:hypothetical protein